MVDLQGKQSFPFDTTITMRGTEIRLFADSDTLPRLEADYLRLKRSRRLHDVIPLDSPHVKAHAGKGLSTSPTQADKEWAYTELNYQMGVLRQQLILDLCLLHSAPELVVIDREKGSLDPQASWMEEIAFDEDYFDNLKGGVKAVGYDGLAETVTLDFAPRIAVQGESAFAYEWTFMLIMHLGRDYPKPFQIWLQHANELMKGWSQWRNSGRFRQYQPANRRSGDIPSGADSSEESVGQSDLQSEG